MKRCPKCDRSRHYRLSDGRLKCRSCGQRFSWTSAWDSVRLSASTKHRLLELFVLGVPSYRQRFASGASAVSRERFYRLLRACCARIERLHDPFDEVIACETADAYGSAAYANNRNAERAIVFGLVCQQGRIMAVPGADGQSLSWQIIDAVREGGLHHGDERPAYTTFKLRGEHVVLRKDKGTRNGRNRIDGIDGFWSYAQSWLHPHRSVPRRYFHLYLAEVLYRYNHRDEDVKPLILGLLKSVSIQELRPILVRKS